MSYHAFHPSAKISTRKEQELKCRSAHNQLQTLMKNRSAFVKLWSMPPCSPKNKVCESCFVNLVQLLLPTPAGSTAVMSPLWRTRSSARKRFVCPENMRVCGLTNGQ